MDTLVRIAEILGRPVPVVVGGKRMIDDVVLIVKRC